MAQELKPVEVRPVRDEVGFCWSPEETDELIDYLSRLEENDQAWDSAGLVGGISPHDDFLFAGNIYFPLFKALRAKEVIIFGVTHGTVRKEIGDPKNIILLDDYKFWKGPYGNVEVSGLRETIKNNLKTEYFSLNDKAHELEHSIEALIPFLQHFNPGVKITPVMVTQMSFETMENISSDLAVVIADYIKKNNLTPGKDIAFLISSDATHYGKDFNYAPYGEDEKAHKTATDRDVYVANAYLNKSLEVKDVNALNNELTTQPYESRMASTWCGRFSVPFGLLTTVKALKNLGLSVSGKVLRYSDTWTEGVLPVKRKNLGITAPFSLKHWCGHLSAGIYLKQ
ncbi:MAG: AmmeMemoRadiSam system protein B [Ignavibacteria bacterium]|jgi:AmmeMemoRadiSam system protein B|nr:AmmeMemoRadiSam system protein B [Ignavibacteria bacterium]MCU7501564.1 AmmeMemoRadiSam system protein B [Ignavibacteria bacterium]MCU7517101.1 AmmeMemoRadiSam system protein B [Ignavibacteria bacterium]